MRPELLIQNEMISLHEICFIQREFRMRAARSMDY